MLIMYHTVLPVHELMLKGGTVSSNSEADFSVHHS